MKQNRLLITGGCGFLGTYLIKTLLSNGFTDITVVDKVKTKSEDANYVLGDFGDEKLMKPLLKKTDVLFHLAAVVGVDICQDNPALVNQVNYINTKKLIDLSVESNVKKIIFTSSSEVYGNSKDTPFKEEAILSPVSFYGKLKVEIENYLLTVNKKRKLAVGIVRPFNVYGPGQKPNFVIPIFIESASKNNPIYIFGTGKQTRTFTYVEDVAEGIVKLFKYVKNTYEIINIGSTQEYSIRDVANIVLEMLPDSMSIIKYLEYGSNEVRSVDLEIDRRVPYMQKAKSLLAFETKTTLRQGINLMLKDRSQSLTN